MIFNPPISWHAWRMRDIAAQAEAFRQHPPAWWAELATRQNGRRKTASSRDNYGMQGPMAFTNRVAEAETGLGRAGSSGVVG